MRRVLLAGLVAVVLATMTSGVAAAQDEPSDTEPPDTEPPDTEPPEVEPPDVIVLDGEAQRVAVAEAGIAVTFPADWDVEVDMEPVDAVLPAAYADAPPATEWTVVYGFMPEAAGWCTVVMFTGMPMPFDEWADGFVPHPSDAGEDRPFSIDTVELPIGEAIRHHDEWVEGEWLFSTLYLFELGETYYWLGCAAGAPARDRWMSVAETLETLGDRPHDDLPRGVPPEADFWSELGPLESIIAVDDSAVMRAWCEQVLWIAYPDGSFSERVECILIDDPVDPDREQGRVPHEAVRLSGGACEWVSDYWLENDGSEVWADSWEVTIEPDGGVVGTSWYGTEVLECHD